jgi:hypothetical protein
MQAAPRRSFWGLLNMASNQDDQKEMGITIAPLSELDLKLERNCNQALDFATFLNNFH